MIVKMIGVINSSIRFEDSDSKTNRTYSIRDSIRTKKNDSQVPTLVVDPLWLML